MWFLSWVGPPDPQSTGLVEARRDLRMEIDEALTELGGELGAEVLASSIVDECYRGQRNYKVDTGYRHRCSLRGTVLVGFEGDFRSEMFDFDDFLKRSGWVADEWPGQRADEFWEMRAAESDDGTVDISRLGKASPTKGDLTLSFEYSGQENLFSLERISEHQRNIFWGFGPPTYDTADLFDLDDVLEGQPYEHLVLIVVEGNYYSRA